MRTLSSLWVVSAFFLIGAVEGFFKRWRNVALPPGECVLGFDYCKISCSYCTVCYVNLIECSLKFSKGPGREPQRNTTDICVAGLDKCKAICTDCTPCYTSFINCKDQMNNNDTESTKSPPPTLGQSAVGPITSAHGNEGENENQTTGLPGIVGTGAASSFKGNTDNTIIDIGIPGTPVFIVDKEIFPGLSRSDDKFNGDRLELSHMLDQYKLHDQNGRLSLRRMDHSVDQQQEDAEVYSVPGWLSPTPVAVQEHDEIMVLVPLKEEKTLQRDALIFPQQQQLELQNAAARVSQNQDGVDFLSVEADVEFVYPSLGTSPRPMSDELHLAEKISLEANDDEHHESLEGTQTSAEDLELQGSNLKLDHAHDFELRDGLRNSFEGHVNIDLR